MQLFLAIVQMIPIIIQMVKQVEAEIPTPGQGTAKLNFILDAVNSIVAQLPDLANQAIAIQKAITGIVTAVVTLFNSTGVFKKA